MANRGGSLVHQSSLFGYLLSCDVLKSVKVAQERYVKRLAAFLFIVRHSLVK